MAKVYHYRMDISLRSKVAGHFVGRLCEDDENQYVHAVAVILMRWQYTMRASED